MKQVNFGKLKDQMASVMRQAKAEDSVDFDTLRYVAGFDISYRGEDAVCAAVVFDLKEKKVVERQVVEQKAPMKFVPGFLALREGPLICQAYFSLENEPDVLMIDGTGIADENCGTAAFVGVELGKPAIGVAKKLGFGEEKDGLIYVDDAILGKVVKTREYANPLYVSPGHMISVESAANIVIACVVPPHKMPEPVHVAHRVADKKIKNKKVEQLNEI